ncbi:MAG: hypothetical protein QM504_10210 [Pseudomonadota bacterium]
MQHIRLTYDVKTFSKSLKKIRLENKNKWFVVFVEKDSFVHSFKIFNSGKLWVQIARKEDSGKLIYNDGSPMDMSVGAFNAFIDDRLDVQELNKAA